MGRLILIAMIFILATSVMAEDAPPFIDAPPVPGVIVEEHPLGLQPDYLQAAANTIFQDLFGQQLAIDAKNEDFLNNSTDGLKFIPGNLTIA